MFINLKLLLFFLFYKFFFNLSWKEKKIKKKRKNKTIMVFIWHLKKSLGKKKNNKNKIRWFWHAVCKTDTRQNDDTSIGYLPSSNLRYLLRLWECFRIILRYEWCLTVPFDSCLAEPFCFNSGNDTWFVLFVSYNRNYIFSHYFYMKGLA